MVLSSNPATYPAMQSITIPDKQDCGCGCGGSCGSSKRKYLFIGLVIVVVVAAVWAFKK
jgi:hypothetical protein